MRAQILVTLASLLGAKALAPFQLSDPIGMDWNSNQTNFTTTWSKPFNITKNFISGFSSGSMLSSNILRLDADNFDGFGLLSGLLFKNFTAMEPANYDKFEVPNLNGKIVYTYAGSKDMFPYSGFMKSVDYFKKGGANVTHQFIHDFNHVMPSNLPVNEMYHPEASCQVNVSNLDYFVPPVKSVFRNCGYNLAYYMLQAWSQDEPLNERELNHTALGDFHAFNQSAFVDNNTEAKMGEIGYIYIPHACKQGNFCQSVMFLHGCMQAAGWWNDTEARRTGLLEYAATNNLIVIFPQNDDMVLVEVGKQEPFEIKYCWSSMQTNDKFHPQIQSLHNMLNSLILGSESELVNMIQPEVTNAARAQKFANKELMEIERALDLSDFVLQI